MPQLYGIQKDKDMKAKDLIEQLKDFVRFHPEAEVHVDTDIEGMVMTNVGIRGDKYGNVEIYEIQEHQKD